MSRQKRVVVLGYKGKMGQVALQVIDKDPRFTYEVGVGREDNLEEVLLQSKPDCVLDLSDHSVVFAHAKTVIAGGFPLVVGASGLQLAEIEQLRQDCHKYGASCLIVPNFSLAACAMAYCSGWLARYFEDVAIIERHHKAKKDSPSGTAKHCAQVIDEVRAKHQPTVVARQEPKQVPIASLRMHGVLAEQEVVFANAGDSIALLQKTTDREAYKPGIALALESIDTLTGLVVGLESLLFRS